MSARAFISRNLLVLVMVPAIIGGHYGWYKLQLQDSLVTAEERKKLPFSSFMFDKWHLPFTKIQVAADEPPIRQEYKNN